MKKLILLAAVVLAGCTTSREIIGPDGAKLFSINCNGTARDISYCYEKAGELCGAAGYEVINTDGSSSPMLIANRMPGGAFNMTGVSIVTRNVMARCKAPT